MADGVGLTFKISDCKQSHRWSFFSSLNSNDTLCHVWENYKVLWLHHKPHLRFIHNTEYAEGMQWWCEEEEKNCVSLAQQTLV